ncbi:MAG: transposase [Planctomycetota bacterium]
MLHAISLASTALTVVRGRALDSRRGALRRAAEVEALRNEVALLREELRLKEARMAWLMPSRRPHYKPLERMAILELRSRRAWSVDETADRFLVEPKTVASWMRRLRALCPTMGRHKIAEVLARAGLHLGSTTVQRMSRHIGPDDDEGTATARRRQVVAKAPNHVWSLDLTVVPTNSGFCTLLRPFAWLQRWPFCFWVAVVADQHSRRAMGFAVFRQVPKARDVTTLLRRAITAARATPRYVLTDRGKQFTSAEFKQWCRRRGIRPRYGAVGRPASIAVVERLIRSIKDECTRRLVMPMETKALRRELALYLHWYNYHRPHQGLEGRTPDEVHSGRRPAIDRPRFEPRPGCHGSSVDGRSTRRASAQTGASLRLVVTFLGGRRHLPVVQLREAA